MAADEKWYFTKEQLANTPSRKSGYDADKELSCRQQAANFIQDMGQRLQVSQLCINTAIVYMHRFYVFHSFKHFHRHAMAAAALFLAAKVEEQPRKLEHVIKVTQICMHRGQAVPPLDVKSEQYLEQAQDLVFNENVLLQTLGFDVAIDHPHTHVVRCCHLVRASKDLAQTSYFMASNSLHLTTMCLQYKPTVVACFCIHLACKWSNWEIPPSSEGKYWFYYVDRTVTQDLLEQLTAEFLVIFDKCPSRLKRNIMTANQNPSNAPATYQFDKMPPRENLHEGVSFQTSPHQSKPSTSQASQPLVSGQRPDYQEKRDRERQMASQTSSSSQHREGHHRGHHPTHPHPTSASALLKPHAGVPPHGSKPPHPAQHHRPAPPHHAHHSRPGAEHQQQRTDRQSRPEHSLRPDHHSRIDPLRPDQARADHLQRLDHQTRPEHQQRAGHPSRSDHSQRPEQMNRSDLQVRPDQLNRLDHQARPDQINRADHQVRPDHLSRSEHQTRSDHARPDHQSRDNQTRADHQSRPEQAVRMDQPNRPEHNRLEPSSRAEHQLGQHGGVTAARDQLRREAALQREASRRDNTISIPSTLLNHSPAQRMDSGISVGSSGSAPSSQEWAGFGGLTPSLGSGAASSVHTSKHPAHSESSHRQFGGQEVKPKSSSSSMDLFSRPRSSVPGADRRPISSNINNSGGNVPSTNTSSGATSTISGGSVKDMSSSKQPIVPYSNQQAQPPSGRHRRPHDNLLNLPPVPREESSNTSVSLDRKIMQEISEIRQLESFFGKTEAIERLKEKHQSKHPPSPLKEMKKEFEAPVLSSQHCATAVPSSMNIKREKSPGRQSNVAPPARIKSEPISPPLTTQVNSHKSFDVQITGKPIKTEVDSETNSESRNGTAILKSSCPSSPGITFSSPPATPGKFQVSSNRNRSSSSCSETEPVLELTKIDKEPGFENVVRDGRIDMKTSALGLQHVESSSPVSLNKCVDSRQIQSSKVESKPQIPPKLLSVPNTKSPTQSSGLTSPVMTQGRSALSLPEEHQSAKSPLCKGPVTSDSHQTTLSRPSDSRPSTLTSIGGDLGAIAFPASEAPPSASDELTSTDHHHKSKKKKEKKEKHKHKDKDKEKRREDKKHKSKHKEKDKERRKADSDSSQSSNQAFPAIKLTIPKVNITPPPAPPPVASAPGSSGGSLKLKINLAQISSATSVSSSSKDSRKRDRDRSSPGSEASTSKIPKISTVVDTPKRGGSSSNSASSKSGYARQNGLESRSGGRHGQQPQHYSGSKMASSKPSELAKGGSSHSSTS